MVGQTWRVGVIGFAHMHVNALIDSFAQLPNVQWVACADSRPIPEDAPSIAGQVHHVAFHVEMSSAWLKGDRADRDWAKSWSVREVDAKEWDSLRRRIRAEYDQLVRAVGEEESARGEALPTVIGAIAHAAYHLGAIRQRLADSRRA